MERIEYKFYEANKKIVSYNEEYDRLFILLDGQISFSVDIAHPEFRDNHIQEVTKDTGYCKNSTFKKLN